MISSLKTMYDLFIPLAKEQGLDTTPHPTVDQYFKSVYTCGAYQLFFKSYSMGWDDGLRGKIL